MDCGLRGRGAPEELRDVLRRMTRMQLGNSRSRLTTGRQFAAADGTQQRSIDEQAVGSLGSARLKLALPCSAKSLDDGIVVEHDPARRRRQDRSGSGGIAKPVGKLSALADLSGRWIDRVLAAGHRVGPIPHAGMCGELLKRCACKQP